MTDPRTPEEAIEALAERLYSYSERLDPTPDGQEWHDLPDSSKEIWRYLISDIVRYEAWISLAQKSE
jgi:hypothetical protein